MKEEEKSKKPTVKGAGQTAVKLLVGGGGLTVSALGLKQLDKLIPEGVPPFVKKIVPGLTTMVLSYVISTKVENANGKALAFGIGIGGGIDLVRKLLGDKIAFIQENTPALSGLGVPGYAAVNQGDFPPSYYKENAFQGLGNAYALSGGVPMNGSAYSLSGGVPMNGASAYALT